MAERLTDDKVSDPLLDAMAHTSGISLATKITHFKKNPEFISEILSEFKERLADPDVAEVMSRQPPESPTDPLFGVKQKLWLVGQLLDVVILARQELINPDGAASVIMLLIEKFMQVQYHDSYLEPTATEVKLGNDTH